VLTAFESLATEERATSTTYFIWMLSRRFVWESNRLRDFPIVSQPVAVILAKDTGEIESVMIPLPGKNFIKEEKKFFPASVLGSPVFSATTTEHSSLMDKLSGELGQAVINYFGGEPVLMRAGTVSNVVGSDSPQLLVRLAESVSGSTTSKIDKIDTTFSLSDDMTPLVLPVVASSKKIATSTVASTTITIMPADLVSIFGKKATSTWKKKPFWFETQGGQILRMYPL